MKLRPIRYKGCEIKREHGRYYGYTLDGQFLGSSDWLVTMCKVIDARQS
jgi:hypothetical protein